MPTVGRNDPCPCGSGKKYKSCCLRQDQIKASRTLNAPQLERLLADDLFSYAFSPAHGAELTEAFDFYWGGVYVGESGRLLDPEDLHRMGEWFAYDYRTKADGTRLIDQYAETQAGSLPKEAQEILQAWTRSVMGLFRVIEVISNNHLELYDILRGAELTVWDTLLSRNASVGDLLIGRLFELAGQKRLSMMTMILPEEYEPGLTEYVRNAYRLHCEERANATWDEFLREYGHIFNAYLLSAQAEALRSLIGAGTHFYDPAETRDRLRSFTRKRAQEQRQERAQELEQRRRPAEHRTRTGIVLPGASPKAQEPAKGASKPEPEKPRILIPGRDA